MVVHKPSIERSRFNHNVGWAALYIPVIVVYIGYLLFISLNNRPPIDYITFMQIGQRYLNGESIWLFGSYYPLPYVMIFAWFSTLPAPVSIFVWHLIPMLVILYISKGKLWPLLFGPVLDHFIGGQSVVFAMLGLYLYRQHHKDWRGGLGLALMLMKPNLALLPLVWAGFQWLRELKQQRRISLQIPAFAGLTALIFLPAFLVMPDWVSEWMPTRRPIVLRSEAGIIPRSIIIFNGRPGEGAEFWVPLIILSLLLLAAIWLVSRRRLNFDTFMLFNFIANPYVHDYDLLQMLPLLDTDWKRKLAIVAALPTWLVIFFAYDTDWAWIGVTLTAPVLLIALLYQMRQPVLAVNTPDAPLALQTTQS